MNKKLSKVLHTGIAAAMMLSMGNFEVFAEETDSKNNDGNETETTSGNTEKISINNDSSTEGKEETVYVITDASGEKQNVIVSDWLKNGSSSDIIKDYTTLKDIVNVKGDETYSTNSDGSISWNAEGKDIYYQGTTDAELPVSVKLSYQLDGADISAEDLSGKSGHVTIRFDYENNSTKEVTINGKKATIKTPFAMVSGVELPNDKFTNIQVENGKVISEGDNAFVIGMAFPGLKESLDLDDDKDLKDKIGDVEIPEYVQIEADVTDFSMDMTMTLASSSFLSDLSIDDDGSLDELRDDMNTLQSSAQELVDGTQTLKDGTSDLVDGAKKLDNGASDLKNGTSELYDGAGKLDDGAGTLKNGASDLYTGTSKVDDGAGTLKSGTSDLYTGTSKVDDGAGSLASGATKLSAGANALSTGAGTLADGTNALQSQVPALKEGVTQLQAGAESVATGTEQVDKALSEIINGIEVAQGQNPSLKDGMQAADAGAKSLYATLGELQKQYVKATSTISSPENEYQSMLQTIAATYDLAVVSANQAKQAVDSAKSALDTEHKTAAAAEESSSEKDAEAAPAKRLKTLSLMEVAGVDPDEQDEAGAEKDAQISNLTSGNNALTSKNQVLESSNSDLQKENETLTSQNQALKDQNTKLSDENQKLKDQIASLQAQHDTANKQTADNLAPTESVQQSQPADTDNSADTALNQTQKDAAQAPNADDTNTNVNSLGENASETDGGADGQAVAQSYVSGGSVYSMSTDGSGLAPYPTDKYDPTSETGDAANAYNNAVAAYNAAVQNCQYLAGVYTTTAAKLASATNSTRAQLDALNSIFGAVLNGGKVTIVDAAKSTADSIAIKTYTPSGNMKDLSDSLDALNSGLTTVDESLNALHSSMKGSEKSPGLVPGAKAVASGLTALNTNAGALAAGVDKLNTGADNVKTGAAQVAAGASRLNDGATSLKSGTSELKSGAKQLDDGASSLKSGTSDLKSGAKKLDDGASDLKSGTSDLKTGAKKLDDGASDLKNGTSDLVDGAVKLDDGAQELLDGMTKFKEEGIDKLADLFGDNLTDVIDRLKEVCDAGAEYSSFAGNDDNGTNTVKFIFKTDAIKSASDSEN